MSKTTTLELNPSMDLCMASLEEAALKLGKADIYTLTVSLEEFRRAKELLKELHMETKGNIFSPYVNLLINPSFTPYEWELSNVCKVIHSRGA